MVSTLKGFFVFFFLLSHPLWCDWNETFDQQSHALFERLPRIWTPDYSQEMLDFIEDRNFLLRDYSLQKQIQKVSLDKKLMVEKQNRGLIVKKRRNNHIHDLYAWELSCLLNASQFVLPAFPIEIGGKRVIIQNLESFEVGSKSPGKKGYSKGAVRRVSLESYWKAHFLAYILGFSDLAAQNIGINSKGEIRFFDNEASFIYYNTPFKTDLSFSTGFLCESYDWPQYRSQLDSKEAIDLRAFVDSLSGFERVVRVYLSCRPFSLNSDGLFYRLDKLRSFSIQKGSTFRDFFGFVYPQMSPGLDELNQIVGSIYNREVDHGSSLFFVCSRMKRHKLTDKEKEKIRHWIETYIE